MVHARPCQAGLRWTPMCRGNLEEQMKQLEALLDDPGMDDVQREVLQSDLCRLRQRAAA